MLTGSKKFKPDNTHSFGLSCSGFDIYGPRYKIEDNTMSMSIELDHDPVHKLTDKYFCDDIEGEGWLVSPYWMKEKLSESWWNEIEQKVLRSKHNLFFHYLTEPINNRWLDWQNRSMKHIASPILTIFSSHFYIQEFCKEHFKSMDPGRCAFVLGFLKAHNLYDRNLFGRDYKKIPKKFSSKEMDISMEDL